MDYRDVNTEYERIFGTCDYPNLYDTEDEEYRQLRMEITGTPRLSYSTSRLPFEDIYAPLEAADSIPEWNFEDTYDHPAETDSILDWEIPFWAEPNYKKGVSSRCSSAPQRKVANILSGILSALAARAQERTAVETDNTTADRHIFKLLIPGRCKAEGYFEKETKRFYILAGSLISLDDESEYMSSSSYRNRQRIINKCGLFTENYIRLDKNVKCRSAVAAARYVVGDFVNMDLWKDSKGRTLYDVYPELFF